MPCSRNDSFSADNLMQMFLPYYIPESFDCKLRNHLSAKPFPAAGRSPNSIFLSAASRNPLQKRRQDAVLPPDRNLKMRLCCKISAPRSAIRILKTDETGKSKFNGNPDLPSTLEWPRNPQGTELDFLAQIPCPELPPGQGLPETGTLFFFCGCGEMVRSWMRKTTGIFSKCSIPPIRFRTALANDSPRRTGKFPENILPLNAWNPDTAMPRSSEKRRNNISFWGILCIFRKKTWSRGSFCCFSGTVTKNNPAGCGETAAGSSSGSNPGISPPPISTG